MSKDYELFSVMSRIEGMSNQFTKTDWKIVQYIKQSPESFISESAGELAKLVRTSDASIIRFCQKVGYSGLNELKYTLQKEMKKKDHLENHADFVDLLQDNHLLLDTLYSISKPQSIERLKKMMMAASRIFIIGFELNRHIVEITAHKLRMLGLTILPITDYDTLKLYHTLSKEDDLFLAITLSGNRTRLANALSNFVKQESKIVLISNYEKSLCSAYADLTFLIPKTGYVKTKYSISREIYIMLLVDMIFHSFLFEKDYYLNFKSSSAYIDDDDIAEDIEKLF